MLARNDTIMKWALYAGATLLLFFLQSAILQRMAFWGLIPFLYPLLAAIPATFESPSAGTIFALSVGVATDLLLPGPIPCFYTLIFPLVGLCASLLAESLLPAGLFCSLLAGADAFLLTGLFHGFLLMLTGRPAWAGVLSLTLRELLISLPLALPLNYFYRRIYLKTHTDGERRPYGSK